ncbi:MAG: hypothetical protein AB1679_00090 [Actinomycetota bacterium]
MTLMALTSIKHAPGVTTAALAMATAWSADHEVVVVEADPAGGDLAARLGLPFEPGLVSLAAAARHGAASGAVGHAQLQAMPCGGSVLVGPGSAEQAVAALRELRAGALAGLAGRGDLVVVDCGRWSPGSPTQPLISAADLVLVVTRPTVEGVVHLRSRMAALRREAGDRVAILLVGERPYRAADIDEAVGLRVAGVLADDPRAATALYQSPRPGLARRFLLVRSARSFLERAIPLLLPESQVSA